MERIYYRDQVLETIARKVLCAYDAILFYGDPQPIPVEEIIESYGISLEYQYLRIWMCVPQRDMPSRFVITTSFWPTPFTEGVGNVPFCRIAAPS